MWGIAGAARVGGPVQDVDRHDLQGMVESLQHLGPDGRRVVVRGNTAMDAMRLTIMAVGAAGHQPLAACDGRYLAAFNGEIYNDAALRAELIKGGHIFRGGSDT